MQIDVWNRRLLVFVLGASYGIGEQLQRLLIGPNWIRWYLSDFGFALAAANFIFMVSFGYVTVKKGIILGLLMGIGWEILQFVMGSGDPIDVICILTGGIIGLLIIGQSESKNEGVD